jgi:histidine triad (HIT) family protein
MATLFTKIIQGEIPCHTIDETSDCLAFLDIRPIRPGHTLVIPKIETDYFFDLTDDQMSSLMTFAKRVARRIDAAVDCQRVGVMVAGLEVPHAHVHLVPINSVHDLNFANARQADPENLARIAETIRSIKL